MSEINLGRELVKMCNYYKKRNSRIVLEKILRQNDWSIYGYKKDNSDAMTDYFDSADWCGVATKGRYIICIDQKNKSGFEIILNKKEIKGYSQKINIFNDKNYKKIESLKRLAEDNRGAKAEQDTALKMIQRLKNKTSTVEEVEAMTEKINFPKTNYIFFIWDTKSKSIVYKTNSLTTWNDNNIQYNSCLGYKNGRARALKITNNQSYYYENYTMKEINDINIRNKETVRKINSFIDILDSLDDLKKCFRLQKSKTKKGIKYVPIKIESWEQLKKMKDLYIEDWDNSKYKLVEIKKGENCSFKSVEYAIFKKALADGKIGKGKREKIIECDYFNRASHNAKFFTSSESVKMEWTKQNRELQLGTTIPKIIKNNSSEFEIIENSEQKGFEIKFKERPGKNILENLKKAGFRWSRFNACWWIKQSKIEKSMIVGLLC